MSIQMRVPFWHQLVSLADRLDRVVEQPLKIPYIAGLALAVNEQKPELAQEVLEVAATCIQKHLDAGAWREVKLVLRFLGSLQSILEGDGVFLIFEDLFARAVDLQTASSEDVSSPPTKET